MPKNWMGNLLRSRRAEDVLSFSGRFPHDEAGLTAELAFNFDFTKVRHREVYFTALLTVINAAGSIHSLEDDGQFSLAYGSPDTLHILYHHGSKIPILMEPETGGWTARHVYLALVEFQRKEYDENPGMRFLFKFPNRYFGRVFADMPDDVQFSEWANVYGDA